MLLLFSRLVAKLGPGMRSVFCLSFQHLCIFGCWKFIQFLYRKSYKKTEFYRNKKLIQFQTKIDRLLWIYQSCILKNQCLWAKIIFSLRMTWRIIHICGVSESRVLMQRLNCWLVLMHQISWDQIINSQGGGPYAFKILLGWVVNGPLRGGNSDKKVL